MENVIEVGKIAKEQIKSERVKVRTAKQKALAESKRATRMKFALKALGIILLVEIGFLGFRQVALWFDYNKLVFSNPMEVSVKFNQIVRVEKREPVRLVEYVGQKELDEFKQQFKDTDREIVDYICEKWGPTQCVTATAVAKSENFWNKDKKFVPDRYNINTNNTLDVGIFMVNTVHFNKPGCALAELVDAKKNIDCAYQIWKDNGESWEPWVAYINKSYLAHVEK